MNDIDDIVRLMNEFHSEPTTAAIIHDQLAQITTARDNEVLIVQESDHSVGMAIVQLLPKLPKIECRINEVVVTRTMQGQGYGGKLMKACEQWAWDHGADLIEFSARPSREAANHLYQKLGYTLRHTNTYHKTRNEAS